MFANVYRAMRDVGMPNPREVDELELWEIAVLIGSDQVETSSGGPDDHAHLHARVAYEMAREAHERGEGPAPDPAEKFEWSGPTAEEMELMAILSSGSSIG